MSHSPWHWTTAETDRDAAGKLSHSLGIHHLTAACLLRLGLDTPDKVKQFLNGQLSDLADPFAMAGMAAAVDRLAAAVEAREPVLVYGDYDADGVTSTALLTGCLRRLGVPAGYYIPGRLEEGYGLHSKPLEDWATAGNRLVVSVDCGSNDFAVMTLAQQLGLDLIITDHHQVSDGERPVTAFINPKQPGCAYPAKELAGVGVAWNLARALHRRFGLPDGESASLLDLVAIGTIADVSALQGENRILVRHGLAKLRDNALPGLTALARKAALDSSSIGAYHVAFILSPRLNAPGRLGDAAPAVELLLAENEDKTEALAGKLEESNRQRQQVEAGILEQARTLASEQASRPALVLWHQDWHPGVVGIVAGRLAGEFGRPAVLIALSGEEGRGSARSGAGFDLVSMFSECAGHLRRYGGHKEAAGLAIDPDHLEAFRDDFCRSAARAGGAEEPKYIALAEVALNELSLELARELEQLQPFGQGNPEPVFLARSLQVVSSRLVGSRSNHLQLKLKKNSQVLQAIRFGVEPESLPGSGDIIDCAFTLQENSWQGRSSLSLHLRGLRRQPPLIQPAQNVFDRRGGIGREDYLVRLAQSRRLLLFANTKTAVEALQKLLPASATVTHLGQAMLQGNYDALAFYHLPYDRAAVEKMMSGLEFNDGRCLHLLFGQEDLDLNERIFAAGIPGPQFLEKLVSCLEHADGPQLTPERLQHNFAFPLTRRLLSRSLAVLSELGVKKDVQWQQLAAKLNQSNIYLEGCKMLAAFRSYQQFWLRSEPSEIAAYLKDPVNFSLSEGVMDIEAGRIKSAN